MTSDFNTDFGLDISSQNLMVYQCYWQGVHAAICANAASEHYFDRAVSLAPDLAIAYADAALIFALWGQTNDANKRIQQALISKKGASKWEQDHVSMVDILISNSTPNALSKILHYIKQYPNDAFILSQITGAYGILAFSGNVHFDSFRLQLLESLQKVYNNHYWFQAMYAYSLAEKEQLDKACDLAEASLKKEPNNGHAIHSYAHVLYESGKHKETVIFLNSALSTYLPTAPIAGHNHWHHAMALLKSNRLDEAKQIYNRQLTLSTCHSPNYGLFVDGVAFLWRTSLMYPDAVQPDEFYGWYAFAQKHLKTLLNPFCEVHLWVAALGSKNDEAIQEVRLFLHNKYSTKTDDQSKLMVTLIESIHAQGQHSLNWKITQEHLAILGGSHAQRDLITETLNLM